MSVLIEATSLVVPQHVLAASYPGGLDTFTTAMRGLADPPRFVAARDPHLVSVGFRDAAHLVPARALLARHGVVDPDIACVDATRGPLAPCPWLRWKRHRDGFTYAWLHGASAGDLAVPDGWNVEDVRAAQAARAIDPDLFRLANEDGVETWLDTRTGRQLVGIAPREDAVAHGATTPGADGLHVSPPEGEEEDLFALLEEDAAARDGCIEGRAPLMRVVCAALDAQGWTHQVHDETLVTWQLTGALTTWECAARVGEEVERVIAFVRLPARVPADRRHAVAEYLVRANFDLGLGNFDLDFDDGEVRFRIGVDVEGGQLGRVMVRTMYAVAIHTFDHHHPGLMRLMFGAATVADALAMLQGGPA